MLDEPAHRAAHGLEGKLVLAIGGRLHEQKGVGKLLEMLTVLAPQFPELRLIVMGKRDVYDAEFAPRARVLGVHERVVPTGWLHREELAAAERGVLLRPLGNVLYALPPACTTDAEADRIAEVMGELVSEARGRARS